VGRSLRATLSDWWLGGLAAPSPFPDTWESGWREALRSACEALTSADGAIDAIDLRGDRWIRVKPGRILRLNELAREVVAGYGVDAQVGYVDDAPVVRVTGLR